MEIERQRGISVATSVLAFEYKGKKINILDTPGHKDFAGRYLQNAYGGRFCNCSNRRCKRCGRANRKIGRSL